MRTARHVVVTLIGVATVLLAATPALAATTVRLRLSASRGAPGAPVAATLSYPGSWSWYGPSCKGPVSFSWDGRTVAQARPGWSGGGSCTATVTITPPAGASGSHAVRGSAPSAGSAQATYRIDSAPTPAQPVPAPARKPTATPPPLRIPTATESAPPQPQVRSAQPVPSASALAPATGSPDPSTVAAPGPVASATPSDPAALAALDAPVVIVHPAASTPLGVWVLMAGGALIVVGAALVAAVRLLYRRKRVAFSI